MSDEIDADDLGPAVALHTILGEAASDILTSRVGRVIGWSIRNTSAAAGVWRLWDAGTTSDLQRMIGTAGVGAGLSDTQYLGDRGILFEIGLVSQAQTGTFDVVVWVRLRRQ